MCIKLLLIILLIILIISINTNYKIPIIYNVKKRLTFPKVKFSHTKFPANNIPGLLPNRHGETLGLNNHADLSLQEPIHAPIVDLPKSKLNLYKYRKQDCCPYNGSYCQCTNNYIPVCHNK